MTDDISMSTSSTLVPPYQARGSTTIQEFELVLKQMIGASDPIHFQELLHEGTLDVNVPWIHSPYDNVPSKLVEIPSGDAISDNPNDDNNNHNGATMIPMSNPPVSVQSSDFLWNPEESSTLPETSFDDMDVDGNEEKQ